MTAFLKFTQLIVGWETSGWDFRHIYNAIAAADALDCHGIVTVAQGTNRQLLDGPKAISSTGWTSLSSAASGPAPSVLVVSTEPAPVHHLSSTGGPKLHTVFQFWSNKCQVKWNNHFCWHPDCAFVSTAQNVACLPCCQHALWIHT